MRVKAEAGVQRHRAFGADLFERQFIQVKLLLTRFAVFSVGGEGLCIGDLERLNLPLINIAPQCLWVQGDLYLPNLNVLTLALCCDIG